MISIDEYLQQREKPRDNRVMTQSWLNLSFLHYTLDAEVIQSLLPKELTLDTYPDMDGREMAWIGIVPFEMCEVRPTWAPAVPWLSYFPEFNVRTYVHCEGRDPGVWFFSLDAARYIACAIARATFALPYYHAQMSVLRSGNEFHYQSKRILNQGDLEANVSIGDSLPLPVPESLEFFLLERYRLYAKKGDQLFSGRVWHEPYQIRKAELDLLTTTLPQQGGLQLGKIVNCYHSEGVTVDVFPLRPYQAD